MIAEVIPVKRGKITLPCFDYEIPESLTSVARIGQLVEIPLRSKKELGIIKSLSKISTIKNLKPVTRIIHPNPFLDSGCLKFLEEISVLYHTSLGSVVKSALPPLQKRKLDKISVQPSAATISGVTRETAAQPAAKTRAKPKLFVYKNLAEKKSYLEEAISRIGQTLIIVPEAADADQVMELLGAQKSICIVTGYLSEKKLFDIWMKIWRGEVDIIIGTRRALFMSFRNLQTVILVEAWHESHKSWDAAPRVHSRDAALIAAKHYNLNLHIIGHTPAVEDYFFANHNVFNVSPSAVLPSPISPNIIDLRNEARIKNFGPISHVLEEELLSANHGSIFLYCNRRGSASYVMCRDCSHVLKCKKCSRAQTYHERAGVMTCHYCGLSETMLSSCAACSGVNLMFLGRGTESILKEIRRILPNDHREIINIEASLKTLGLLRPDKDQIIVGTQLAWPHLNWKNLSLMAFVDADTPLFVPEFRSAEHVWDLIHDASFRLDKGGAIFVQTNHPEHPVYANLAYPEAFYSAELQQRMMFGYPPFKYLLKLFFGTTTKEEGKRERDRFTDRLVELTKGSLDTKITPPLEIFPPFQKGLYWQVLVFKLSYQNYKQQLKQILAIVPESWKVDPNPNTLLGL